MVLLGIISPGNDNATWALDNSDFEPVREHDDEVPVPLSPGSAELTNYNEYLRQVTPQYVRSALETVVKSKSNLLKIGLENYYLD